MRFLTVSEYRPVMLEITSVNTEEGKGTCVNVYFGFMSNKHIYAKLPDDVQPSEDFPEYIRVKRGKTVCPDKRHYFTDSEEYAIVRGFEFPDGKTFSKDKRITELDVSDIAVSIIKELWPNGFNLSLDNVPIAS